MSAAGMTATAGGMRGCIAALLLSTFALPGCGRQAEAPLPVVVLRLEVAAFAGGMRVELKSDGKATCQHWGQRPAGRSGDEIGEVDVGTVKALLDDLDRLGFFDLDPGLVEAEVRSEQRRRGILRQQWHDSTSIALLVNRDGRSHRVAYAALEHKVAAFPDIADLQKLHRCVQRIRAVTDAIVFTKPPAGASP